MLKSEVNHILINSLLHKIFLLSKNNLSKWSTYFLMHSLIDIPRFSHAALNRGESRDSSSRSSCRRDRMSLTSFFERRICLTTYSFPSSTITLSEWWGTNPGNFGWTWFRSLWDRKLVVSLTIEWVAESPSLARDVREGTEYFYAFIFIYNV